MKLENIILSEVTQTQKDRQDKSLAWLSSERLCQQLTEQMQILATNHWVRDPYRRVSGRIERAEGNGNPIERTTVSTNLEPWELPETKLPTKEHTWVGPRSLEHMQQ